MTEPAKAEPKDRKRTLSDEDGHLLELYFCQYKSAFSRSITGPMLSKAELYNSGTYPCWWCHIITTPGGKLHNTHSPGVLENGNWCEECNGTGFLNLELSKKDDAELTAIPTAEVTESKGYEPDHRMLQTYGRISRRLDKVKAAAGPKALMAIEVFHGDAGAKWGRSRWGRIFSLYPLTAAGRRLLIHVAEKENNEVTLTPLERLGVQAELQRVKYQQWRKELLDLADKEAHALYQIAVDAWIDAEPRPAKKPKDPSARQSPRKEADPWVAATPAREIYGEDGRLKMREIIGRE